LVLATAGAAVSVISALTPASREAPWEWIVIATQAFIAVALIVYLVRFVRNQRDDYWRERGKDPKRPET
jgi:hypothetical protein